MLKLTDRAVEIIRMIPRQRWFSKTAGLRIARPTAGDAPGKTRFRVAPANEPAPGDRVVEKEGARVFLGPVAWRKLWGRVLEAGTDARGRIQFRVRKPR